MFKSMNRKKRAVMGGARSRAYQIYKVEESQHLYSGFLYLHYVKAQGYTQALGVLTLHLPFHFKYISNKNSVILAHYLYLLVFPNLCISVFRFRSKCHHGRYGMSILPLIVPQPQLHHYWPTVNDTTVTLTNSHYTLMHL